MFNYINLLNNCYRNAAAQLLFKTKGFLAFANNVIECEYTDSCYVCLVKMEHLNRSSDGHKVMLSWDSGVVEGLDPNYQANATYDALMFIENFMKRLASDCEVNHILLYPLLKDVFQIKENKSLQVIGILDPQLQIKDGFADRIRTRLDETYNNISSPKPSMSEWVSNVIIVELPNKSTVFPAEELAYGGHSYRIVGIGIFEDVSDGHWTAWLKSKSSWTELDCRAPSPSSITKLPDQQYVKIALYEKEAVYPVQTATSRVANSANVAMTNHYEGSYMNKVYKDGLATLCETAIRHAEVIDMGVGVGTM